MPRPSVTLYTPLLGSLLVSLLACVGRETRSVAAASSPPASTHAECARSLRIVVQQDLTTSGPENVTPIADVADIEPLIELAIRCGGEIAAGSIRERSNTPLLRLYVEQPATSPAEPELSGPVFRVAQNQREFEAKLALFNTGESTRRAGARERAVRFTRELADILSRPPNARRTDIWGAIARSAHLLSEPSEFAGDTRLVALVVSDALDNVGAHPTSLPVGAELILVNGLPLLGALESLQPRRFESVAAAVRYITATR